MDFSCLEGIVVCTPDNQVAGYKSHVVSSPRICF